MRLRELAGMAIGGLLLVALAVGGLIRTRDLLVPEGNTLVDSKAAAYACLERRIAQRVPAGAAVRFAAGDRDPMRDEWIQRAITDSYPRYRAVAEDADADVVVELGPWTGGCPAVSARGSVRP